MVERISLLKWSAVAVAPSGLFLSASHWQSVAATGGQQYSLVQRIVNRTLWYSVVTRQQTQVTKKLNGMAFTIHAATRATGLFKQTWKVDKAGFQQFGKERTFYF